MVSGLLEVPSTMTVSPVPGTWPAYQLPGSDARPVEPPMKVSACTPLSALTRRRRTGQIDGRRHGRSDMEDTLQKGLPWPRSARYGHAEQALRTSQWCCRAVSVG